MADNGNDAVTGIEEVVDIFDVKDGQPDPLLAGAEEDENSGEDSGPGEAKPAASASDDNIPDKFRGKSLGEVIDMYGNLERVLGRQGHEYGQLKTLADQLLQKQLEAPAAGSETSEVDGDALLEKPDEVIGSLINNHPVIKKLDTTLVKLTRATSQQAFESNHGPATDWMNNEGFVAWIQKNPERTRRFNHANENFDFGVADDLVSTYKEVQGVQQEAVNEQRDAARRQASSPQAGAGSSAAQANGAARKKPIFSRAQLIELNMRDPARYKAMSKEITAAYAEGRVR